jgi:hypothetical protein
MFVESESEVKEEAWFGFTVLVVAVCSDTMPWPIAMLRENPARPRRASERARQKYSSVAVGAGVNVVVEFGVRRLIIRLGVRRSGVACSRSQIDEAVRKLGRAGFEGSVLCIIVFFLFLFLFLFELVDILCFWCVEYIDDDGDDNDDKLAVISPFFPT